MEEQYKSGEIFDHQCNGKSGGLVSLDIEPEKSNPKGGMYRTKNIVTDYISGAVQQMKSELSPRDDFYNDPLPF
jgi:hypothetical protein